MASAAAAGPSAPLPAHEIIISHGELGHIHFAAPERIARIKIYLLKRLARGIRIIPTELP